MKWISVEDELPELNQIVLCYGFSGENNEDPDEMGFDIGAVENKDYPLLMFGLCYGTVTHWMPLEPPKQGDESEP